MTQFSRPLPPPATQPPPRRLPPRGPQTLGRGPLMDDVPDAWPQVPPTKGRCPLRRTGPALAAAAVVTVVLAAAGYFVGVRD
jgi:hypothetical protein